MATYLFRCPECGVVYEQQALASEGPYGVVTCVNEGAECKRAYSLEGVGFAVTSLRQRRDVGATTNREMRDLFLETAEEAATPDDPDGSKAIEEWNESHEPKAGNSNPLRPERPLHSKKVF